MANGAVARLPLPETEAAAPAPRAATELGFALGEAVARAATGLCRGLHEYQNGGLTNEVRMANGERIAALAMMRLDTIGAPGLDFAGTARAEGARVLRTYLDADFYSLHGPGAGEATLDGIISAVLEVVEKVVADELAHRAN